MDIIYTELKRAKDIYPEWPDDLIHQVAIMNEESGEAIRAALNHVYHNDSLDHVKAELVQTAAMCIRCIEWIDGNNSQMELF